MTRLDVCRCFAAVWIVTIGSAVDADPPRERNVGITESDVRAAVTRFEREPTWKHRVEALVAVAKGSQSAAPVLARSLESRSEDVRVFAAHALALLRPGEATESRGKVLTGALQDPSPFVRAYAAIGLHGLGRLREDGELYRATVAKESDRRVRRLLSWLLERDDADTVAAATRRALRDYHLADLDTARLHGPAPDFTLRDAFGNTYRLADFRGKSSVILKFYNEPL